MTRKVSRYPGCDDDAIRKRSDKGQRIQERSIPSPVDGLLDKLQALDRGAHSDEVRSYLLTLASGAILAAALAAFHNWFAAIPMFPPSFSSGGFEWSWDWGYELTAAEAMSLVLGLGAITATLSVAVVAASWRTDTDCPGTERRVDAWNVGMQGVLKMLAILSVTSSLLVDHSRRVLGVLLIAASLLTAIVAVRIVERPALFSMAMEEFVLERKVRRLADSVEEQERRCPWLRRYSPRMLPSVIEIAAVVLVSMTAQLMIPLMYFIAYFAWVPSLSVLDLFTSENRLALGSWIDAGAPIAFAAVVHTFMPFGKFLRISAACAPSSISICHEPSPTGKPLMTLGTIVGSMASATVERLEPSTTTNSALTIRSIGRLLSESNLG